MRLFKHCNLLKYLQTRGCVVARLVCVSLYFAFKNQCIYLQKSIGAQYYTYIKIVHVKLVLWAKGLHDSMKTR